jgi:hypothetical protein
VAVAVEMLRVAVEQVDTGLALLAKALAVEARLNPRY